MPSGRGLRFMVLAGVIAGHTALAATVESPRTVQGTDPANLPAVGLSDTETVPPGFVPAYSEIDMKGNPISTGVDLHRMLPDLAPPRKVRIAPYQRRRPEHQQAPKRHDEATGKIRFLEPEPIRDIRLGDTIIVDDNTIPLRFGGDQGDGNSRDDVNWLNDRSVGVQSTVRCEPSSTAVAYKTEETVKEREPRPETRLGRLWATMKALARTAYALVGSLVNGSPRRSEPGC